MMMVMMMMLTTTTTYRRYAGVVGQHKSTDAVSRLDVGRLAGQRDLDAGRTPRDELRQLAFTDPLQAFVHLHGCMGFTSTCTSITTFH